MTEEEKVKEMNGIEKLTGWAATDLKDGAYLGVHLMIEHYDEIDKIARRFCCNNRDDAFKDIFEKGLQELLDLCDMDDRLTETEAQMQNPANGIVTTLSTPRW